MVGEPLLSLYESSILLFPPYKKGNDGKNDEIESIKRTGKGGIGEK